MVVSSSSLTLQERLQLPENLAGKKACYRPIPILFTLFQKVASPSCR